jgi:DNA polymerase-3 subunit alpha
LQGEKETLGFYLTGHPVAHYVAEFKDKVTPIKSLNPYMAKKAWVCALVKGLKRVMTKTGKKLLIMTLEDQSARFEVVVFDNVYEELKIPLQVEQIIVVEGELSHDNFNGGTRMLVNQIFQTHEARVHLGKRLTLTLTPENQSLLNQLQAILNGNQGECPVQIHYKNDQAQAVLTTGESWRVNPTDELLSLLRDLLGADRAIIS